MKLDDKISRAEFLKALAGLLVACGPMPVTLPKAGPVLRVGVARCGDRL